MCISVAVLLDHQLIACDLQNYYLMGKLHVEVDVECAKVTEYLSPVHVYSQCSQPNVFMSADVWPEGAYVPELPTLDSKKEEHCRAHRTNKFQAQ